MPELLVRMARVRRRLHHADSPEKRLRLSQELDRLIIHYYRIKMNLVNLL